MKFKNAVIESADHTEITRPKPDQDESFIGLEEYYQQVATKVLNQSGHNRDEIRGLAIVAPITAPVAPMYPFDLAETLGFEHLEYFITVDHGGVGPLECLIQSAMAVEMGKVDKILCIGADTPIRPHAKDEGMVPESPIGTTSNFLDPFGNQGPNSRMAGVQMKHMSEYGTTKEQIGKISVIQRQHASKNSYAYLQSPIDMSDYLNSQPISDPICLLDCVIPVNGGAGFLISSKESISNKTENPIYIHGTGQCLVNYDRSPLPDMTTTGIKSAVEEAFQYTEFKRDDADFLQLYDDYPIIVLMQIEDLGICSKGEGGPFVKQTDLSIDGEFPLNTSGGQLSFGQIGGAGGMLQLVEGVQQLQNNCGDRQIKDANWGIVTGVGGLSYGRNLQNTDVVILSRSAT